MPLYQPLSQAQRHTLNTLSISLAPIAVGAFGKRTSYWANYDAIEHDGIHEVSVRTQIIGETIGSSNYLHVNCYFEEGKNLHEHYGLVYGDDQFEAGISAYIQSILDIPTQDIMITYTEAGMQGEDYISLEGNTELIQHITSLSKHRLLSLIKSGNVQTIRYGDLCWAADS
jgi:hypothetical protein